MTSHIIPYLCPINSLIMKIIVWCVCLLLLAADGFGQLVRKKDYDAAFALQLGGETGMLTTFQNSRLSVSPTAGLKMTFPFNRKWFLGSEINYSRLKYSTSDRFSAHLSVGGNTTFFNGNQKASFDMQQIQVPVYLKYMLNCNKASVLFGFYGAYVFNRELTTSLVGDFDAGKGSIRLDLSELLEQWNAGITIGYEHRIVKHLNVMCRLSAGLKDVVNAGGLFGKRLLPLQGCITISYDIFRIGDCGCD